MLSILNKLALQKEFQNFVTNILCFWTKIKTKTQQQQQNIKANKKLGGAGS